MEDDPLKRIAAALERLAPPTQGVDLSAGTRFRWTPAGPTPVGPADGPPLSLLLGVDMQKDKLLANTRRFAAGARANHALLWGARGTGKSALIKAVHAAVSAEAPALKLVEAPSQDTRALALALIGLRAQPSPVILFLDDLSFETDDAAMKALKPALDGGLNAGGRLIVYATSNRRHLVARDARENSDDLFWKDTAEEHLALADRFGLWLGFHVPDQAGYLAIVRAYAAHFKLPISAEALEHEALLWARTRAARSGRTAWQFIVDLAGRLERELVF